MPSPPPSAYANPNPTVKGSSDASDIKPTPVPTLASRRLRKIPPIPIRSRSASKAEIGDEGEEEDEDDDDEEEGEGEEDEDEHVDGTDADGMGRSSPIVASSIGLNYIRTRSNPSLPLRLFSKPDEHRYKGRDGDVSKDPRPAGPTKGPSFNSMFLGLGKTL